MRPILILTLLLAVAAPLLIRRLLADPEGALALPVTYMLVWPLSAVLIASTLIAPERGSETAAFLLSLPARRSHVWTAKSLVRLGCLAAVLLTSIASHYVIARLAGSRTVVPMRMNPFAVIDGLDTRMFSLPHFSLPVALAFLFFGIGLFASAIVSRAMTSLVAGALGSVVIVLLLWLLVLGWAWPIHGAMWVEAFLLVPLCLAFMFASSMVFARSGLLGGRARFRQGMKYLGIALCASLAVQVPAVLRMARPKLADISECWRPIVPSPDGNAFLIWAWVKDDPHIWRAEADGANLRLVGGRYSGRPVWSPEGTKIAFSSGGGFLWRVRRRQLMCIASAHDSRKHYLRPERESRERELRCGNPVWSPDGGFIAYTSRSRVWVARADGSPRWEVTPKEGRRFHLAGWTPDGMKLYVTERLSRQWLRARLWLVSRDGKNSRVLADNVDPFGQVVVGVKHLLFRRRLKEAGSHELWIVSRDGGDATLLERAGNVDNYGFSGDEGRVYFYTSSPLPQAGIWMANIDGSERQRIARAWYGFGPLPSPGGRHILFWGALEGGEERKLWAFCPDDIDDPVLVTSARGAQTAQWLSDDTLIFWRWREGEGRSRQLEVWTVGRDGSDLKRIL